MDAQHVALVKYLHGTFNSLVFLLCCLQGYWGLTIRRARVAGKGPVPQSIRRHRKVGPFFALLGLLGVIGGLTLGYFLHRVPVVYNLYVSIHLLLAFCIAILIILTFFSSRKIKNVRSIWRSYHALLGACLICFYSAQVMLGLAILL